MMMIKNSLLILLQLRYRQSHPMVKDCRIFIHLYYTMGTGIRLQKHMEQKQNFDKSTFIFYEMTENVDEKMFNLIRN